MKLINPMAVHALEILQGIVGIYVFLFAVILFVDDTATCSFMRAFLTVGGGITLIRLLEVLKKENTWKKEISHES